MKIIYDQSTLRVVAMLDDATELEDEHVLLKTMFPKEHAKLASWAVSKPIQKSPVHLTVGLDDAGIPETLYSKGKPIYKCDKKDKEKIEKKRLSEKRKELGKAMSRSFLRSMGPEVIRLWTSSRHTQPQIATSLSNLDYFWEEPIRIVSWWGPFTDAGGYANMNREIVFRLHNHHIIPKVEVCPTAPQVSPHAQYKISKYAAFDLGRFRRYPKIWAFTPLPHAPHSGKNIFFTMMETETIHPEFVRLCNAHSDEVWVPSKHNKRAFQNSGVTKPIYVFPLGIDETLYEQCENADLGVIGPERTFVDLLGKPVCEGINKFRFLSLFGWSYRKGPDVLIQSFIEQFDRRDDVTLIIVSRHSGSPAQEHIETIKNDAMRYAGAIRKSNLPQVILYPHVIPEQEMPSIMRMGHVFIHLSRGEGFSLPQIEAAACGLPVISCNNTGMSEYLTDDNALLVKTDETEVCSPEMHWITAYYQGQQFPKLGRAQIEQSKKHMEFAINNYPELLAKGKSLRESVYRDYTWSKATERVAKRIKEISEPV